MANSTPAVQPTLAELKQASKNVALLSGLVHRELTPAILKALRAQQQRERDLLATLAAQTLTPEDRAQYAETLTDLNNAYDLVVAFCDFADTIFKFESDANAT